MIPLSPSVETPPLSTLSTPSSYYTLPLDNMVVATATATATNTPVGGEKIRHIELPIIDLAAERSEVAKQIVKACEEFGFFNVINHGVSEAIIKRMEEESFDFFAKPSCIKQQAGPANPYGYGYKNIGFNGDKGEVEYLLLDTNPSSIAERSKTISNEPMKFRFAASGYVEAVRELACDILEVMAEGLGVPDTSVLSSLVKHLESDSLLRLNYYPPLITNHHHHHAHKHHFHQNNNFNSCSSNTSSSRIGFGEHTDPQILTLLRSNDVGGLQISLEDGEWVPVPPHPSAFCVNVGDVLQVLTNGKFRSVRHRAVVNSCKARMSMAYFASPTLHSSISPIPELATRGKLYRSFTWADYKMATYSRRLGDTRLKLFAVEKDDDDQTRRDFTCIHN